MILGINAAKLGETKVYLKDEKGKVVKMVKVVQKPGSQVLLPMIVKILKSKNLDFSEIAGIEVATGPGSFTGLRVGISVANAMGAALKIPINNQKTGKLVYPKYE